MGRCGNNCLHLQYIMNATLLKRSWLFHSMILVLNFLIIFLYHSFILRCLFRWWWWDYPCSEQMQKQSWFWYPSNLQLIFYYILIIVLSKLWTTQHTNAFSKTVVFTTLKTSSWTILSWKNKQLSFTLTKLQYLMKMAILSLVTIFSKLLKWTNSSILTWNTASVDFTTTFPLTHSQSPTVLHLIPWKATPNQKEIQWPPTYSCSKFWVGHMDPTFLFMILTGPQCHLVQVPSANYLHLRNLRKKNLSSIVCTSLVETTASDISTIETSDVCSDTITTDNDTKLNDDET